MRFLLLIYLAKEWDLELIKANLASGPCSKRSASSRMWAGRVHEIQYRSNLFRDDKYSASQGNMCFVNTVRVENVS